MSAGVKLSPTEDEITKKSLEFIDKIAAEVDKLPKSVQNEILELGKILSNNNVSYIHVVSKRASGKENSSVKTNKDLDRSRQS